MTLTRMDVRSVSLVRTNRGGATATLLDAVDVSFRAGAVSLLVGPTGAGKTTLLHLLGGLIRPTTGEILADDDPVSRWTAAHRDRWRRQTGLLFQRAELIDDLSAGENVLAPLIPRPGTLATKIDASRRTLASLDAAHLERQPVRNLSGGERQRVALARALVADPALLLLDEPTAHQDDTRCELILDVVTAADRRGAIVVVASHDARIVSSEVADAVYALDGGRLSPGDTNPGHSTS